MIRTAWMYKLERPLLIPVSGIRNENHSSVASKNHAQKYLILKHIRFMLKESNGIPGTVTPRGRGYSVWGWTVDVLIDPLATGQFDLYWNSYPRWKCNDIPGFSWSKALMRWWYVRNRYIKKTKIEPCSSELDDWGSTQSCAKVERKVKNGCPRKRKYASSVTGNNY